MAAEVPERMEVIFAMYFGQVAGIQYHPANPPDKRMSLLDCSNVAVQMCLIHSAIFDKED